MLLLLTSKCSTRLLSIEHASVPADNMWWSEHMKTVHQHPAPTAPRCLPCNYTVDVSLLLMKMASGCPCTPALMCSVVHGYKDLFSPQSCGIPRSAWLPLS